ncbi:MAG TPA: hypothetical protein VK900_01545 [Anaerolineales bacterium]|nr:hypothetical protein [Anaerolineales bacterium]
MKLRLLPILLLLVLSLAACAPAEQSTATNPPAIVTEPPVAAPATSTPEIVQEAPTDAAAATEIPSQVALPVATSRGPDLHATDPTTVSLASGGLQFVEFFRFT